MLCLKLRVILTVVALGHSQAVHEVRRQPPLLEHHAQEAKEEGERDGDLVGWPHSDPVVEGASEDVSNDARKPVEVVVHVNVALVVLGQGLKHVERKAVGRPQHSQDGHVDPELALGYETGPKLISDFFGAILGFGRDHVVLERFQDPLILLGNFLVVLESL